MVGWRCSPSSSPEPPAQAPAPTEVPDSGRAPGYQRRRRGHVRRRPEFAEAFDVAGMFALALATAGLEAQLAPVVSSAQELCGRVFLLTARRG